MSHDKRTVPRLAIGLCGCVVGAYCAISAFRQGQAMAPGYDGYVFGAAFAAVVVGSWFILPLAQGWLSRAGWFLCTGFVLANAIGYTATHRTETVGGKQNTIAAYNAALTGLEQATERLTAMKGNRRWESTKGCTDVTAEQSVTFCHEFSATQAKADQFQAVVSAGKPATTDAQADTIGWVIRVDAATVGKALPIFWAVALDIAVTLFMYLALAGNVQKTNVATPVATKLTTELIPVEDRRPITRKARKSWSEEDTIRLLTEVMHKPLRLRKDGRPDRRFKAVKKVANDVIA
jgi:hypothetical protein